MHFHVAKVALLVGVAAAAVLTARVFATGAEALDPIPVTVAPGASGAVWAGEIAGRARDTLHYRFELVGPDGSRVDQAMAWRVDPPGPAAIVRQTDTAVDVVRLSQGSALLIGEVVPEAEPAAAPVAAAEVRQVPTDEPEVAPAPARVAPAERHQAFPNEPEGFVPLMVKDFSDGSLDSGGWWVRLTEAHSRLTLERGESPVDSDYFARFHYLVGYGDGEGLARMISPDLQVDELYVRTWLRWDPNWEGHRSGVNKVFYLLDRFPSGQSRPWYVLADGVGDGPLHLAMVGQGENLNSRLHPNLGNGTLVRGEWTLVEVYWVFRKAEGEFRMWLNGELVARHRRPTLNPASDGLIDAMDFHPIIGGRGGELQAPLALDLAYMYMSAPPRD
ncbi:MAG TPA: hypothetical protein VK858_10250 [Longimicrobiales bacterium]|nr:hypothetical protein [Longimicrobiales bacterium]